MADYDAESYDLYQAIKSVSQLVDGIDEAEPSYKNNQYLKQLSVDFDKLYNTYYDVLYSLCEIAVKQDKVDYVREELKDDNVSDYNFNEIIVDIDYLSKEAEHEDLMYSVEVGDKVRLSNGNEFYVVSIDGNDLWVSKKKGGPEGRYADLHDVVEIIEPNNEW